MRQETNIIYDNYYEMLLDVIPKLNYYPKVNGGEGVAYFLNDKFIVKEYLEADDWEMFDHVFNNYCEEIQKHAEMGYQVPHIYAWLKVPNMAYYSGYQNNQNKYYILEERIKGRKLYYGFLEEFYPMCKDKFSKEEFFNIVHHQNQNPIALDEIVRTYLEDYIQMNEFLSSVSEDSLAEFIVSAYQIHMSAKHSEPDLYPCNVLIDGDDFKLIDNNIHLMSGERIVSEEKLKDRFFNNLINLFLYNENITELETLVLNDLDKKYLKNYDSYKRKNEKLITNVIDRILKFLNKYCDKPKISDPRMYMLVFATLKTFMGFDNAVKTIAHINTTFQP